MSSRYCTNCDDEILLDHEKYDLCSECHVDEDIMNFLESIVPQELRHDK